MSAIGWQGRLNEATSPEEVLTVCRAFLACITASEMAELPPSCLPAHGVAIGDISPYALKLIRQLGGGERSSAPALHELTTFFTKAALRLAQISTQIAAVTEEQRRSRSR